MTSIDPTDPAGVLFRALVNYGLTSDEKLVDSLSDLYQHSMATVELQTRLGMLTELSDLAEQRKLSPNALLPFLFRDTEASVVSSAALSAAGLWPGSEADPLLGVRELAGYARGYAENDEPRAVAILSGLLLLGDRRVTDLLQNCWRWVSAEGRTALSHLQSGTLHAPLIDWFIDWLADCEQRDFGVVAAALTRMSQVARGQLVVEVERLLPVWEAKDGQPIRVLQEWTFSEFAERIRPRLEGIAKHESDPPLVPAVMQAWELLPPPLFVGPDPDYLPEEKPRDLLALIPPAALERSRDVPPIAVFERELLAGGGDLILCWGIFNPRGPTLSCFGRLKTSRPDVDLLFYRMNNPFRRDGFVVGTLVGADRTDGAAIARMLFGRFRDNWIADLGTSPLFLIAGGAPNFILSPWEEPAFEAAMPQFFLDSPAIRSCALADDMDHMRRHPLRPWDRTAEQRDKAIAELLAAKQGKEQPKRAPQRPADLETVETWYKMVTASNHVTVELACLPGAWTGAIEHCGSPELQASAYSVDRLNGFLAAFDFPIFKILARAFAESKE